MVSGLAVIVTDASPCPPGEGIWGEEVVPGDDPAALAEAARAGVDPSVVGGWVLVAGANRRLGLAPVESPAVDPALS